MKKIITLFVLLVSMSASANSPFIRGEIVEVILHDWGTLLIVFSEEVQAEGNPNGSEGCINNKVVVVPATHQFFNQIYSGVLAAYHSKDKVHGWVEGCHPQHNAPLLTRLDMDKLD